MTRISAATELGLFGCLAVAAALGACSPATAHDWGAFDVLKTSAPLPTRMLGHTPLKNDADYAKVVRWGADWFRTLTFGNEHTMTDVAGLLDGEVEVPCEGCAPGCTRKARVLPYVMTAIDDLDGVRGNLFQGNGGPDGNGYTSDLVVRFPKGTKLFGTIPVPEALHTGFDVEAGSPLPIGVVPVPAPAPEQSRPELINLADFGATGPNTKVRLGLTCAVCHFSLDVDWDGKADLKSAWLDHPTPGSKYRPEDAWAIGNQDIHFGWLFSLSANPLLGFTVQSGPVGPNSAKAARDWTRWVKANYRSAPEAVMRSVAIGMLAEPRGWADDTPDAIHNPNQFPVLYTHMNWPYNVDGVLINASDRNNNVWTGALEFTGLIGLSADRAGGTQKLLFWQEQSVYADFTAAELADVLLYYSPAVTRANSPEAGRAKLDALTADVLGTSDGVPGLLDPDSVVVMRGLPNVIPEAVYNHPANAGRRRTAKEYGGDAEYRNLLVGMLGIRVKTPKAVLAEPAIQAFLRDYPEIANNPVERDELATEAVSVMLNWLKPPTNKSTLLAKAAALVEPGYRVFKEAGCANCHRGPLLTDNIIRGYQELGTNNQRAAATAPLQTLIAPAYDPKTGEAVGTGFFGGLFGERKAGYKTLTLRYLWGSAPYLHDGGVGVSLDPAGPPAGDDLRALLSRQDKLYGVARALYYRETNQAPWLRSDAALSLQALLLKSERAKVLTANQNDKAFPVPGLNETFTINQVGVEGVGHDFYIDDVPGGERISALVAFLLALDDCPGQHASPPVACTP